MERTAYASVGVEESDQLGALEVRNVVTVVIELEKNLESGAVASGLELAPETALVTANTVHEAADVAETVAEVLLQRWPFTVDKHQALVEYLRDTGSLLGDLKDLGASGSILRSVSHTELIVLLLEIRANLGDSTGHERIVEVDVSNALREFMQTVFVAGQVRAPLASSLVQKVPAEMSADTGVHTGHNTVEHTLLKTLIVNLEASVCDKRSVGVLLTALLKLSLATRCIKDLLEILGSRTAVPSRLAEIGRLGERALLETILSVDGVPDLLGPIARITSESFRVSNQAHVIAL
jgi:hypothetical protein